MAAIQGVSSSRGSADSGRAQEVRAVRKQQDEEAIRAAEEAKRSQRNATEEKGSRVDTTA